MRQESKTDNRATKAEERLLYLLEAIEPAAQAAKRVQPRDGPLNEPALDSQSAAMRGVTFGEDGCDSEPTQHNTQRFGVIASVALEAFGKLSFGSRFPANGRYVHEHLEGLRDFVDVRRGGGRIERDSLSIGQHMMLATRFPAI